jgi:hypothetical protein
MEMRIVVGDAVRASALAERLTIAFGTEHVSFGDSCPPGQVRIERDTDRTMLGVLDAVERWLDHAGRGCAGIWLADNSYRLARCAPIEAWQ